MHSHMTVLSCHVQPVPNDILLHISAYMSPGERQRLRGVCAVFLLAALDARYKQFRLVPEDEGTRGQRSLSTESRFLVTVRHLGEPHVARRVRELCLTVPEIDPDPVLGAHDEIVDALVQALTSLGNLTALRMKWGMGFLPAGLDLVMQSAWPALGPRLTRLSIWLDVTLANHLITLGTWATGLQSLALLIEGNAMDPATSTFEWAAMVPTLIAPSVGSLELLRIEIHVCAVDPPPGMERSKLRIGLLFSALAEIRLPKLHSLTVDSPFDGASTCHEEEPLIRLVASLPTLQRLSITPSSSENLPYLAGRISVFARGYKTFLERALMAADTLPRHITRLALRAVEMWPMRGVDVLPDVIALLSSWPTSLEELWLGGRYLRYWDIFMVLDTLQRHASTIDTLRLCVDFLRPSMLDRIVAAFPHLHTLAFRMRGVGPDLDPTRQAYLTWQTPDDDEGFIEAMLGRTYDCALRELRAPQAILSEAAADVLQAAFPSLSHMSDTDTTHSFATWRPYDFLPTQTIWGDS